jgi:N-methylhydantoinase A/oxoprolinase/acetone carboxylase beta subunit
VGPRRVVPLSRLAASYPQVKKEIGALKNKRERDRRTSDLEYWFLYKHNNTPAAAAANARQQELMALLADGPLCLSYILKRLNLYHPLQLQADDLIRQGFIEQATLTPTDLLHVTGRMNTWCVETARQMVEYACELFSLDANNFAEKTLDRVVDRMVEEAIIFLGRQTNSQQLPGKIEDPWGRRLVNEAIKPKSPYLAVTIASRIPVIGIGAPADIFVKRIAQSLHASFILPQYAPVANAVGAVAGSVIVEKEAIVYARESSGVRIYVVQIEGENTEFAEDQDANDYAEQTAIKCAQKAAAAAGAVDPRVMVETSTEGNLQRIRARGIGNPIL